MQNELTIKDGKVVYDLNALTGEPWDQLPLQAVWQAKRWTKLRAQGFGYSHWHPLPGQPTIQDWHPYPFTSSGSNGPQDGRPTENLRIR